MNKKNNLITVLKKNKTGLLSGLCRVAKGQEMTTFQEVVAYESSDEVKDNIKIDFSLNEKYLGSFVCHLEVATEKDINVLLKENGAKIYIYITFEDDEDYGEFKAILETR